MFSQSTRIKTVLTMAAVILGGITAWFLFRQLPAPSSQPERQVSASIFPVYDITRQIAGDAVEVKQILPPGASPHSFEPSPSQAKSLAGSNAVFIIGHGLDSWAEQMAAGVEVPTVISLDKNIALMDATEDDHADEEVGSVVDLEVGQDPHYWLSVPNAILMAAQVRDELSQLYPDQAEYFTKNYQEYESELQALNQEVNDGLTAAGSPQIATFHSAWNYFAQDHPVTIVATFEEFPGQEPSAAYLAEFQTELREHQVKAIFSEPQFSTQALEPLAQDSGVSLGVLDPVGGVEGRQSYTDLMRYNVKQIQAMFGQDSSR